MIQASMELGELGTAAAGAVPKPVELGHTSHGSGISRAAVEALAKIHRGEPGHGRALGHGRAGFADARHLRGFLHGSALEVQDSQEIAGLARDGRRPESPSRRSVPASRATVARSKRGLETACGHRLAHIRPVAESVD